MRFSFSTLCISLAAIALTLSACTPEPGEMVLVPQLSGLTRDLAQAELMGAGLVLGAVIEETSDTVPLGETIRQTPAAGTSVAPGTSVDIVISTGPAIVNVTVPDVVGRTRSSAESTLTSAGLELGNVAEQSHPTIARGRVISQDPAAGASVASGASVDLVISTGPANLSVPDLSNSTQSQATSALAGLGLTLGSVTQQPHPTVPAGSVISQDPAAGASVPPGTAVNIVVSTGPEVTNISVPDVRNLTQAQATATITAAGLVLGAVSQESHPTVPAGSVISQTPPAGASVPGGTAVNIVISTGPAVGNVTVPTVTNLTQAAASAAITGAGLTLGTVTQESHPTVSAGSVISQNPAAGASVPPGTAIDIVVSTGPAGTDVIVPELANLPQADAVTAITGAGLVLGTITTANHPTVAAGSVISQVPSAGTSVAPGTAVHLVISTGPVPVDLPPPAPQVGIPDTPTDQTVATVSGLTIANGALSITGGANIAQGNADNTGVFSINVPLLLNRVNRLLVTVTDGEGLESAPAPVNVIQDSQDPTLFIDFPPDGAVLITDSTVVAGRIADTLTGFMELTVEVNGEPGNVNAGIGTNGTFERAAVPLAVGDNLITATAFDAAGNSVTAEINITRVAADTSRIEIVSGEGQTGAIHRKLPEPIVVRALDENGDPITGKLIQFDVTRSDGTLSATSAVSDVGSLDFQAVTDAEGLAQAFWSLGSDAGSANNRVEVSAAGIEASAFFCASSTPGPASQINIGSGNNQKAEAGAPAPETLRAWVNDACNGIGNVPVTFTVVEGDGLVNGEPSTVVNTSSTGHAEVTFTLGAGGGNNAVEATFEGYEGAPAVFTSFGLVRNEAQPTSFSGVVLDNASQPIQGATCTLLVDNVPLPSTTTNAEGQFIFTGIPAGSGHLFVNGLTATAVGGAPVIQGSFPGLAYDFVIVPNAQNSLTQPVLLPELDPANARTYNGTQDVVLTCAGIEGLRMTIKAGSMRMPNGSLPSAANPTIVSLNQVHITDVPMAMPDGASPPFAWTLQPGGATFDPPVQIEYPNMAGLAPGAIGYFLTFNHATNRFEIVASGHVTADGSTLVSDPGSGLNLAGWGGACPPYPATGDASRSCETKMSKETDASAKQDSECSCPPELDIPEVTDPKALSMEQNHITFTAADPEVQTNLNTVQSSLNTLREKMSEEAPTAKVVVNSAYRPQAYQDHLYAIKRAHTAIKRMSQEAKAECSEQIAEVDAECAHHGHCGNPVAEISDHTNGKSVDLKKSAIKPLTEQEFIDIADESGFNVLVEPSAYHLTITDKNHSKGLVQLHPDIILDTENEATGDGPDPEIPIWTYSLNGQTVTVLGDIFSFRNISVPDNFGPEGPGTPRDLVGDDFIRIMGVQTYQGITKYAFSEPFQIIQGSVFTVEELFYTDIPPPLAVALRATVDAPTLTAIDQTTQVHVTAILNDGTEQDVTSKELWTTYRVSNPRIASVNADGQVTAKAAGTVFITATNDGVATVVRVSVVPGGTLTTVMGLVQDDLGEPIVGARVSVLGQAGDAISDATGAFSIAGVAATAQQLSVAGLMYLPPYVAGIAQGINVSPGGTTDVGLLVLEPICTGLAEGEGEGEPFKGLRPECVDGDQDGLDDYTEQFDGYDPNVGDTDGDGVSDGEEDFDSDGIINLWEELIGTRSDVSDSDFDGINDGQELQYGFDPLDSDGDRPLVFPGDFFVPQGSFIQIRNDWTILGHTLIAGSLYVTGADARFTIAGTAALTGTLTAANGAILNTPIVDEGSFRAYDAGIVNFSDAITTMSGNALEAEAGIVNALGLTTLSNCSLFIENGGILNVPQLAAISGCQLHLQGAVTSEGEGEGEGEGFLEGEKERKGFDQRSMLSLPLVAELEDCYVRLYGSTISMASLASAVNCDFDIQTSAVLEAPLFTSIIGISDEFFNSASLTIHGTGQVNAPLSTITNTELSAYSGGVLELPLLSTLSFEGCGFFVSPQIYASGEGIVSLPNVVSVTASEFCQSVYIEATSGGRIELPVLASIFEGEGYATLRASGTGSVIDIPSINSLSETSSLSLYGGGAINIPLIETLNASVNVGVGSSFELPALTQITGGSYSLTGEFSAPLLESAQSASFNVNAGTFSPPLLSSGSDCHFYVYGGATLNLNALTNADGSGFTVSSATLNAPQLAGLASTETGAAFISVSGGLQGEGEAEGEGEESLPGIFNAPIASLRNTRLYASDGAVLSLPLVTELVINGCFAFSNLEATRGGVIDLTNVTRLDASGEICGSMQVNASSGGSVDLSSLIEIDLATSLTFSATGPDTVIDLSGLTQAPENTNFFSQDGGQILIGSLESLGGNLNIGPGGSLSLPLITSLSGGLHIFQGDFSAPAVTTASEASFNVHDGADVDLGALAMAEQCSFYADTNAQLSLNALTSAIDCTFTMHGGAIDAPQLSSIVGTESFGALISISNAHDPESFEGEGEGQSFSIPGAFNAPLTSLTNVQLHAQNNGVVGLPLLTELNYQGCSNVGNTINASVRGRIELPSVVSLDASALTCNYLQLTTNSGGVIDLSGLTAMDSSTPIYVNATGLDSLIDLSALTALPQSSSLGVADGGEIRLNNLQTFAGGLSVASGSSMTLPALTALTGGSHTCYGALNAPLVATASGSAFAVYGGGQVTFDSLASAVDCSFNVYSGAFTAPQLSSVTGTVDNGALIYVTGVGTDEGEGEGAGEGEGETVPGVFVAPISSLTNVRLLATNNGNLTLPTLTSLSYEGCVYSADTLSASEGGVISLPNLALLNGAALECYGLQITANSGGMVDLSSLSAITLGDTFIQFSASGAGSNIDLSALTVVPPNTTFIESEGGVIQRN